MLQVDLRELSSGPVDTHAELAADDPLFEPLEVALAAPVRLLGRLHAAGEGRFYWRGSLRTRVAGECRRCLAPVAVAVAADSDALLTRDTDYMGERDTARPARDGSREYVRTRHTAVRLRA